MYQRSYNAPELTMYLNLSGNQILNHKNGILDMHEKNTAQKNLYLHIK